MEVAWIGLQRVHLACLAGCPSRDASVVAQEGAHVRYRHPRLDGFAEQFDHEWLLHPRSQAPQVSTMQADRPCEAQTAGRDRYIFAKQPTHERLGGPRDRKS